MNKKFFILFFSLVYHVAYAQQKSIDSLIRLYHTTTADTLKIQYTYRLADLVKNPTIAWRYIEEGQSLAQQINNRYYIGYGKLSSSVFYAGEGNYPWAIKNAFAALKIAQEIGHPC